VLLLQRFPVDLVDEVGPRRANIRNTAVVGGMVDEKTDIVVSCLIGIVVIQLSGVSKS
jgi:hypothetical protein